VPRRQLWDAPDVDGRFALDERELADTRPPRETGRARPAPAVRVERDGRLHGVRPWVEPRLTVGRADDCAIVLRDAGVSRRHAVLERRGDVFEVVDLGSVNGTYVNGRRVERHRLSAGDVLRIDTFTLTFVRNEPPIGEWCHEPTRHEAETGGAARALDAPLPVADLLLEDPLDEEEKEEVPGTLLTVVSAARRTRAQPTHPDPPGTLRLGVSLPAQDLPRRVRLALALLEAEGRSLPVTLSIRLGGSAKR
jgi:hypothetical protein